MKEITLTSGKKTKVDDEDYEWLSQWKWHYCNGYATRREKLGRKFQHKIYMHRVIMRTPDDYEVDHADRNGLNNQRDNLRNCTRSDNVANSSGNKNNTSGYKGVHLLKNLRWCASIVYQGKSFYLGSHDTPEEAARAYNDAARKYHGSFARVNDLKKA